MNYHPTPKSVIPKCGVPPIDPNIHAYLQSDGKYYRAISVTDDIKDIPHFEVWKNNKWNETFLGYGGSKATYLDYIKCLQSDGIVFAKKQTMVTIYILGFIALVTIATVAILLINGNN